MIKKIVSIICVILCISTLNGISYADNVKYSKNKDLSDTKFEKANTFFDKLQILPDYFNKEPYALVTRAEFASWISKLYNNATMDTKNESGNKYLGFTNDPEFDENGDWVWKNDTDSDNDNNDLSFVSTPYYDVLTTHERIDDIFFVSRSGIMSGSGGYFRPDEPISGYEVVTVLVKMCGAEVFAKSSYPYGYLNQAMKMDIPDDTNDVSGVSITYRDLMICLYNALHTDVYEVDSITDENDITLTRKDEKTLLEIVLGIKHANGVMNENSVTSLDSVNVNGGKAIKIDDKEYLFKENTYDDYIGMNVDVYYTGTNRVKCILPGENNELTVNADDIINYKSSYLTYDDNGKTRERYIGSKTNIMYNGKALTDYSDNTINIKSGYIRFIDADDDNNYETAQIWEKTLFWVSGVDVYNEIINNKLESEKTNSLDLSDTDYVLYDSNNEEITIYDISVGCILSIYKTNETQGKQFVTIYCSRNTAEGKVTSVDKENETAVINDNKYKFSGNVNTSDITVGNVYKMYLSSEDEVVVCEKKNGNDIAIGYLIAISCDNKLDKEYKIKLYNVSEDKVNIYPVAEKLKFNNLKNLKAENVFSSPELYNSEKSSVINQFIQFAIDNNGVVNKIQTADFDENEFTNMDLPSAAVAGNLSYKYRTKPNAFYASGNAAIYCDSSTKLVHIPKENIDSEYLYYRIKPGQDTGYKICTAVSAGKKTPYALVVAVIDTREQNISTSATAYMATSISQCLDENGDDAYKISFVGDKTDTITIDSSDLFDTVSEISVGDLFRYSMVNNTIVSIEKVFDSDTKMAVNGKNPYGNESNSFNSAFHYVQGNVVSKANDGAFIVIEPYMYTNVDGIITKTETNPENRFTVKAENYKCWTYDSKSGKVVYSNYITDIFDSEYYGTENASEVVVCSQWGDPKSIYIIK